MLKTHTHTYSDATAFGTTGYAAVSSGGSCLTN